MTGGHQARPHALEKGEDRRRPAAKPAQRLALAVVNRLRTGDALAPEMVHQAEKERQILGMHPLFVESEDVGAALGDQEEIGVLHPLGDALARQRRAQRIVGEEGVQILVGDFGVHGHGSAD